MACNAILAARAEFDPDAVRGEIEDLVSLVQTKRMESRSFETIDQIMKVCAKAIPVVYQVPTQADNYFSNETMGTMFRFYNETVKYIMEGTPRSMPLNSWKAIIEDIAKDWSVIESRGGNIGGGVIKQPTFKRPTVSTDRLKEINVDKSLLSYAHHDIVYKWIERENGVDDMLITLHLLISARY